MRYLTKLEKTRATLGYVLSFRALVGIDVTARFRQFFGFAPIAVIGIGPARTS